MHRARSLLLTLALLACSLLAEALSTDRQQPILIEADRAERNDKLGTIVYQGTVVIKQGSILIRADKVIVYSDGGSASKIVCTGKPAHYQQRPDGEGGLVLASANTIEYILETEQIHLMNNASLEQDGTAISGERIDYDIAGEVVKAKGDIRGNTRTQMIIPPKTDSDSAPEESAPKESEPAAKDTP